MPSPASEAGSKIAAGRTPNPSGLTRLSAPAHADVYITPMTIGAPGADSSRQSRLAAFDAAGAGRGGRAAAECRQATPHQPHSQQVSANEQRAGGNEAESLGQDAAIARDAGLAVQTFYATFGSKRAVLFALLDEMEDAADMHGLIEDLHDAGADSRRQLAALVNFNVRLFEQLSDMFEILRSGAADPDIVSVSRAGDDRRRAGQAPLVRGWAESDALKVGLHASAAADILWSLTSPELFHLFVVRQQWPTVRYASWLTDVLDGILFS